MSQVYNDNAWNAKKVFRVYKLQEAAAAAKFNEHDTEAILPTLIIDDYVYPRKIISGIIKRIHVRIKDAAGDTCILRLYRSPVDGTTAPYGLQTAKLYESEILANDAEYDFTELEIPFRLFAAGKIYYCLEWTTGVAPAGNVQGYLEVTGMVTE